MLPNAKRAWFGLGEIHLPSTPTRLPASMSAACRSMSSMRRSCPRLVSGPDGDARLDHPPRLARRGRALKGQGAPTDRDAARVVAEPAEMAAAGCVEALTARAEQHAAGLPRGWVATLTLDPAITRHWDRTRY